MAVRVSADLSAWDLTSILTAHPEPATMLGPALLVGEDGALAIGGMRLTPRGLEGEATTEADWEQVGEILRRLDGALQWLIGDWLNMGERRWGKTYAAVAAATGYDEKTLRNYAYVAGAVNLSLRRDKLSFGHHALVAGFDAVTQQEWLTWAATTGASIAQMRAQMKVQKAADAPALPGETTGGTLLKMRENAQKMRKMGKIYLKALAGNEQKKNEFRGMAGKMIADLRAMVEALE